MAQCVWHPFTKSAFDRLGFCLFDILFTRERAESCNPISNCAHRFLRERLIGNRNSSQPELMDYKVHFKVNEVFFQIHTSFDDIYQIAPFILFNNSRSHFPADRWDWTAMHFLIHHIDVNWHSGQAIVTTAPSVGFDVNLVNVCIMYDALYDLLTLHPCKFHLNLWLNNLIELKHSDVQFYQNWCSRHGYDAGGSINFLRNFEWWVLSIFTILLTHPGLLYD